MTLRADHIAAAAFVAFGLLVLAVSGDLPMGTLSFPGAGFLPKLVAVLLIVLGLALAVRAGESRPFADVGWSDLPHAMQIVAITAIATVLYVKLGFIITMVLMLLALLVIIERRPPLRAALYSVAVVLVAYLVFDRVLKDSLPAGPFGF